MPNVRGKRTTRKRNPRGPVQKTYESLTGTAQVLLSSFPKQRTHQYTRPITPSILATSTSAESLYGFAFTLNALVNYTEFTSLYDSYQLKSVKISIIPAYTIAQTGVTTNLGGYMIVVPDYDDATATAISGLLQYSTKKIFPLNTTVELVLPDLRTKVGASGATAGNMVSGRNNWFDVADDAQPFYGLKLAFTQTTIVQTYNFIADVRIALRGDR